MTFDTINPRKDGARKKRLGQREIQSTRVVQRLIGEGAVGEEEVGTDVLTSDGTATLTNKTIDADDNTISNLAHGSEVDNPSSGIHGATGEVVGTTDSQALSNKTISSANNTITLDANVGTLSNVNANELEAPDVSTVEEIVPFIILKDVSNAATTDIYSSNAPFKFRVLDVWVVETANANSGTWKIDNGTSDITSAVSYSTADTGLTRASTLDDDNHEIAANGSLRCINSVATDDAVLYILGIRVA